MLEQPVLHNSQLGYYTNLMNLLDPAAVAVPNQRNQDLHTRLLSVPNISDNSTRDGSTFNRQ